MKNIILFATIFATLSSAALLMSKASLMPARPLGYQTGEPERKTTPWTSATPSIPKGLPIEPEKGKTPFVAPEKSFDFELYNGLKKPFYYSIGVQDADPKLRIGNTPLHFLEAGKSASLRGVRQEPNENIELVIVQFGNGLKSGDAYQAYRYVFQRDKNIYVQATEASDGFIKLEPQGSFFTRKTKLNKPISNNVTKIDPARFDIAPGMTIPTDQFQLFEKEFCTNIDPKDVNKNLGLFLNATDVYDIENLKKGKQIMQRGPRFNALEKVTDKLGANYDELKGKWKDSTTCITSRFNLAKTMLVKIYGF